MSGSSRTWSTQDPIGGGMVALQVGATVLWWLWARSGDKPDWMIVVPLLWALLAVRSMRSWWTGRTGWTGRTARRNPGGQS